MNSSELFKLLLYSPNLVISENAWLYMEPQYAGLHIAVGPAVVFEPGCCTECLLPG